MRLLQPPHDWKLEEFQMGYTRSSGFRKAIVHLPSLTTLDARLYTTDTDFLLQLPNLRSLDLSTSSSNVELLDTERILQSLHALVRLTDLRVLHHGGLYSGDHPLCITSEHLVAALAHMPQLTRLDLRQVALDSLRFLSSGPTTRSLQQLNLIDAKPRLPLSELVHVHALSSLTKLRVVSSFDEPLDKSLYMSRRSKLLMPSLVSFHTRLLRWRSDSDSEAEEEEEENE
jgi:hypothetical protein